jgi:hypothetical protein
MIVINNVDSQKFSFNGIEYFKNFTPIVVGNKIRILNIYDSSIELTDAPRLFSEFEINGIVYGDVALTQSSLLPVIFTRLSLNADFLSNNITDYSTATLPLEDTNSLLIEQGGTFKKVAKSEIGGGGASNVKEILVDLYNLPTTGLIETIVATYDVADMVAQDGIIEVNLRHGKNTPGTQEIFIYFSDSEFTFGTKIRRSGLLSSTNSSVGFLTMFYVKNDEISVNRYFATTSQDDSVIGSNAIRTIFLASASTRKYIHIVLNSNVANNIIYGSIKNVK